jgi:hypothetical protein
MKHTAKGIAALLLATLLFALCAVPLTTAAAAPPDYTVTSPYDGVDWATWKLYKGNLHTHSTFSDGNLSLSDVVEEYYRQGYEILGVSDHGVIGQAWDVAPQTAPPLDVQNWFKERPVLTKERFAEITAGTDRGGSGMLCVPQAIELNAAVLYKNHMNGYFSGWGQGWWGFENDYRTPIAMTEKTGGLTVINHPGDWLGSAGDPAAAHDPANINFFGDILRDYKSCLGIEVYNRVDTVTRQDRALWDELLRRLIPEGRQVFGFANDDSHVLTDIGSTAEYFLLPANTLENLRTAMETGAFLASSRYDRIRLGDSFVGDKDTPYPLISNIVIDNTADTIALTVTDTTTVEWIADGEVIATGATLVLADHADAIGSYVRAQLIGPGGITTTQAFVVSDGEDHSVNDAPLGWTKFLYDLSRILRSSKIGFLVELLVKEIGKLA